MVLPRPPVSVKYGTFFLWNVQYHVANVAANTISPSADAKKMPQKKPNTLNTFNAIEIDSGLCLNCLKAIQLTWKYGTTSGF